MAWQDRLARLSLAVEGAFAETAEHQPMLSGSIAGEQRDPSRPARPLTGIFTRQLATALPKDRRVTGRDDTFGLAALAGEAVFSVARSQVLAGEPRKGDRLIRHDGRSWRIAEVRQDDDRLLLGLNQP